MKTVIMLFLAKVHEEELDTIQVCPTLRRNFIAFLGLRKPVGKNANSGAPDEPGRMGGPDSTTLCTNLREERVKSPSSLHPWVFLGR